MTHYDVIIFQKIKLKKNPKTNNCKKNFEIPLNSAKDINITRFTCLRFARQVSPPYFQCVYIIIIISWIFILSFLSCRRNKSDTPIEPVRKTLYHRALNWYARETIDTIAMIISTEIFFWWVAGALKSSRRRFCCLEGPNWKKVSEKFSN